MYKLHPPSLPQCSPVFFFFHVRAFSIQWTQLSRSLEQVTSWLNGQTTNNIVTKLTYQGNKQSLIPKTDVIQLTLTVKITTAQVGEMPVIVDNSPIQATFTRKIILNLLMKTNDSWAQTFHSITKFVRHVYNCFFS